MTIEWTDNNVDWLKRLWAEGWSGGQIGQMMGATRNTIIGKAHRLHLQGRSRDGGSTTSPLMAASPQNTKPTRHRSNTTKAGDMAAKAAASPLNAFIKSGAPDKPLPAFARPEAPEAIAGISFMELTDHVCKWALNDASPWRFCGQRSEDHKSFCELHQRRAYHAAGMR